MDKVFVTTKPPEITVGAGNRQIRLTGVEAIRAACWSLWLLIAARAYFVLASATVFLLAGWWGIPKLSLLAKYVGPYL
jgi:hypothetical protein